MAAAVTAETERHAAPEQLVLLGAAMLISTCGVVYKLVAGALAPYLIGDTLTRFLTVIGTYLFAMGGGAWLARYLRGDTLARFIEIEIATGVISGFSAMLLFAAFASNVLFQPLLYVLVLAVGLLVGIGFRCCCACCGRISASRISFPASCRSITSVYSWHHSYFPSGSCRNSGWCAPASRLAC